MLTIDERTKVWRGMMRYISRNAEQFPWSGMTKFDLYNPTTDAGAIADADGWLDTHQGNTCDTVGFNGALNVPFRSNASIEIKTLLLCAVAAARVSLEFARQLFGEVD